MSSPMSCPPHAQKESFGLVDSSAFLTWDPHSRDSKKDCAPDVRRIAVTQSNLARRTMALKSNL